MTYFFLCFGYDSLHANECVLFFIFFPKRRCYKYERRDHFKTTHDHCKHNAYFFRCCKILIRSSPSQNIRYSTRVCNRGNCTSNASIEAVIKERKKRSNKNNRRKKYKQKRQNRYCNIVLYFLLLISWDINTMRVRVMQ